MMGRGKREIGGNFENLLGRAQKWGEGGLSSDNFLDWLR